MRRLTRISIAIACALGVSAAAAQTVQRGGQEVKPAQTRAPVQTAQAPAGGAATGATAGGAAGATTLGTLGTIAVVVAGVAVVATAASNSVNDSSAVTHNP